MESAFLIDVRQIAIIDHQDENYTQSAVYSTFVKAKNYVDLVVRDISHRYPDANITYEENVVGLRLMSVSILYDGGHRFIRYTIKKVGIV